MGSHRLWRCDFEIVYVEEASSHGAALRREAAIRRLGRAGKALLIAQASAEGTRG
jgi:predicted GIY-YIG superfamily endonuclease